MEMVIRNILCAAWKKWEWEQYLMRTDMYWEVKEHEDAYGRPWVTVCIYFPACLMESVNTLCEHISMITQARLN